jgi:hypothetical protein
MLAFKGTIRPNSKEIYRRTRNGIKKTTNLGLDTAKPALHIVSKQIELS